MAVEGDWTPQDTTYFMVMTLTTVGYGDVSPSTTEAPLAVGYMLFNLCCGSAFGTVEYFNTRAEARVAHELEQQDHHTAAPTAETSRDEEASEQDALVLQVWSSITKDLNRFADSASKSVATLVADAQEEGRRTSVSRNIAAAVAIFLLGTAGFRYMGFGGCEEPKCDLDRSTDGTAVCLPGCRFTCLCTADAAAGTHGSWSSAFTTSSDQSPGEHPESRAETELITLEVANFDECPASCTRTSRCEGSATPVSRKKGMRNGGTLAGTAAIRLSQLDAEYQEWADALYVATYTMTTVGYGDIAAPKHGGEFLRWFSLS